MTLQKKRRYISNFKTLLSLKRSIIKYTETHDNNEIIINLSDSDFIRRVFNEDRRIILKIKTRLKI